jgi:hypothetical protein
VGVAVSETMPRSSFPSLTRQRAALLLVVALTALTLCSAMVEEAVGTQAQRTRTTTRSTTRSGGRTTVPVSAETTMPSIVSTTEPELLIAGTTAAPTADAPEAAAPRSTSAALRWVIIGLIVVGLAIAGLTVAYWFHTRPRPVGPPGTRDRDRHGGARPGPPGGTPPVHGYEGARAGGHARPGDPNGSAGWRPQWDQPSVGANPGARHGGERLDLRWDRH